MSGEEFFSIIWAIIWILILIGVYIYNSFAWQKTAENLKYDQPWLAWIPFGRMAMILDLGDFPWALVFLYLIPIFGWIALYVLRIIAYWKIYEKRGYSGALSLLRLGRFIFFFGEMLYVGEMVVRGLVAWKGLESPASEKQLGSSEKKIEVPKPPKKL